MSDTPAERAARRERVRARAARQAGLLTRWQVRGLGLTQAQLEAEVEAERWRVAGRHTLVICPAARGDHRSWWHAVLE